MDGMGTISKTIPGPSPCFGYESLTWGSKLFPQSLDRGIIATCFEPRCPWSQVEICLYVYIYILIITCECVYIYIYIIQYILTCRNISEAYLIKWTTLCAINMRNSYCNTKLLFVVPTTFTHFSDLQDQTSMRWPLKKTWDHSIARNFHTKYTSLSNQENHSLCSLSINACK